MTALDGKLGAALARLAAAVPAGAAPATARALGEDPHVLRALRLRGWAAVTHSGGRGAAYYAPTAAGRRKAQESSGGA